MSSIQELNDARTKLHALGVKGTNDLHCMLRYLRLVRELGVQEPDGVCEYGSAVLAKFQSRLSEPELCQMLEDVAMASAQCGQMTQAIRCSDMLRKKFPASIRAGVLKGLVVEAGGNATDAESLYDKLLMEQPLSATVMKRQIALLMGQRDVPGAIEQLVTYLDIYQTDREAWEQLCELYVQAQRMEQAKYCAEEVAMHTPGNPQVLMRLADLLYSQGETSGFESALGYYCKAAELSKGCNARSLYGVLGCVTSLGGSKKASSTAGHSEVAILAAQKLLLLYEKSAAKLVPALKALFEAQQISL